MPALSACSAPSTRSVIGPPSRWPGRLRAGSAALLLGLALLPLHAAAPPPAPSPDPASAAPPAGLVLPTALIQTLPPLGPDWRVDNPYRGDARVAAVGRVLFNATCARCHGVDGDATRHIGNDLRQLDGFCHARVRHPEARAHCIRDQDDFFKLSVLEGKQRVGVTHMPAWKGVLSQEAIWSLRTYLESQRPVRP